MILISTLVDDETDREFMRAVYEKNKRLMLSTTFCYTDRTQDREDIVHDTVEKLCKKVETLRTLSDRALRTYIVRAVRHTALNHQKHRDVVERREEKLEEESVCVPDDLYTRLERLEDLKAAKMQIAKIWDKLPEQDRDLLYRRYVFEQGTDELAELFGCSRESIRMRLSRAKKRALLLMEAEMNHDKV